ncbi:MAG TPA: N-acetylmuramoyl-L-alanine amidase [Candidatus Binatia bacterium]|jgi:N-acetylmuramoyl-L-alanine amidase|nr:N-acetylmuramoyl-L-alanine amidase [Candidatus Binatia bacterium]
MSEELRVTKDPSFSLSAFHSLLITLFPVFTLILNAAVVRAGVPERSVVESVHHISAADYTRVVITLSAQASHRLFTVPADPARNLPGRIVIDFSPARRSPQAPPSLPIRDGLLKQVRTGQFSATTVRIVLDVEQIDDYKAFALESPYRLIIDVKGKVQHQPQSLSKPLSEPAPAQFTTPRYRLMLDPGHGGKDPGALGERGVAEKDVVLAISQRLGRKLAEREQVDVLFTRTTDVFVPLEERIARANAVKADLFVSIHANASSNSELQGVETYYLNNTDDRATIRLATLENGLRPQSGDHENGRAGLSFLLSDLIQSGKEEESIALAHHLQEAVVLRAKQRYPAIHSLGVKKGPFYVLVGAHMPCVLVETAFITHPVEGKYLSSSEYQDTLAEGLFLGIARFLRTGLMAKSL